MHSEITDTQKLEKLELALTRLNGANVIVENEKGEILVGRSTYGEKKFMTTGGGIERGELPRHAAVSEAEEESGILIEEKDLTLVAYFIQKIAGVQSATGILFLFWTRIYNSEALKTSTKEFTDIQFMSFEEIIKRREEFGVGYLRMIVWYKRVRDGYNIAPLEKRLSDPVDYCLDGALITV